jgi:hypothetical protein
VTAREAQPRIGIPVFIEEKRMHLPPALGTGKGRISALVCGRWLGHLLHLGANEVIPEGVETLSS